jgi:hypothetical protein
MPSYLPNKDGYGFDGWTPEIATVTSDASYHAQWTEIITFANASWEKIAELSESGEIQDKFSVGDTKTFTFSHTDGSTETVEVAIAGFGLDTLSSGGTAGVTIVLNHLLADTRVMHSTYSSTVDRPWASTELRTWCNGELLSAMPEELRNVIKQVTKKTIKSTVSSTAASTSNDTVWVLGVKEVGLTPFNGADKGSSFTYPLFTGDEDRIKCLNGEETATGWWLRDSDSYNKRGAFANVGKNGQRDGFHGCSDSLGVLFGFCI